MNKFFLTSIVFLFSLSIVNAQFTLPSLPYNYSALEPTIDSATMKIHHSKHHQAYIDNLNKALTSKQQKLTLEEIFANISTYNATVRNNAGGHYNHSLFWTILSPSKNTICSSELAEAINTDFGNMDSLKTMFIKTGLSHFGSGWVWLILNEQNRLQVVSTSNQDNPLMVGIGPMGMPILGIDLWEHAYYLLYQNKRADYLKAIWNSIDWSEVSKRYITTHKNIRNNSKK